MLVFCQMLQLVHDFMRGSVSESFFLLNVRLLRAAGAQ